MQKSIPIGIALILAACGAAVTTDNTAEARQKNTRRNTPQRDVGFPNFDDNAGMAGCFDPNLTGYQRRAAIAAGGRPCATPRSSRPLRPAPGAREPLAANNDFAGRWTLRGESCNGTTWDFMPTGVYYAPGERGLWTLDGTALFLNPAMEQNRPSGGRQVRISIVARSRDAFTMRAGNGEVTHWVRCS